MTTRFLLLLLVCYVVMAGGCAAKGETGESAVAPASPPAAAAPDPGWPRTFEKSGNQIVIYQPQIDSWQDYAKLSFRSAIAVTPAGAQQPVYGVLAAKANTEVDHDTRTVLLDNVDVDPRFPNLPADKAARLEGLVKELLPQKRTWEVSLDRVLAYMKSGKGQAPAVPLDLNPPPIYYSQSPAILVIFVGPPAFKPVKDTGLMFAANTNWDLLLDQATSRYYLRNGNSWLTAADPLKGPWTAAQSLPADFQKLPADPNWQEVRQHIPGQPAQQVPKVFASTKPAELIVTKGEPRYTPIAGTRLMYVSNPDQALFLDNADGNHYYLVAGRWFRAKDLNGPWSAASSDLPADFAKIPEDSPVGYVLVSVPHTTQAEDAILLASVPHKATIDINQAKVDVTYDGPPRFQPIEGTTMTYAANSPQQVIQANGQYYCCYQGVWFVAPAPTGPWAVCTSVPAVIYTTPPTSPLYNVTYVKVYDATPTTVVVGYTAGYTGEYVATTGALMFGAGMLAGAALTEPDSWYVYGPAYYSYGCAAHYSYAYGDYYRSAEYYGPYGGAGRAAAYNPATGTYSRAAYRYGPEGAATAREAYNPYTGNYAAHAGATNGYQSWGRSTAQIGGTAVQAGHRTGPEGSAGWAETSSGQWARGAQGAGGGAVAQTSGGDVYAGKDGNVYRKTDTGQWQNYSNGSWNDVNRSTASPQARQAPQSLNQEATARSYGNQRAAQASGFRSAGGFRGGGRR